MDTQADLAGLVLAGGTSSRMGRDKAGLVLEGERLLDRARRILGEAGAERVFVLGRASEPDGLADPPGNGGPAIAVTAALGAIAGTNGIRALVIPVDMPGLTPSALMALIGTGTSAHYRGEPLPLFLKADALPGGLDTARALHQIAALFDARALDPPDDPSILANINTPEAFARLGGTGEAG